MLERSFLINNMEKEKTKKLEAMVVAPPPVSIERPIEEENSYQKKKIKTAAPAAGQQKRAQSRERDTLMKFQEPVSLAMVAAAAAAATSESSPGANYNNSNIRVDEERGGEGEAPPPSLTMIKEEDEEEEKKETKDSGFRQTTILPSPNQGTISFLSFLGFLYIIVLYHCIFYHVIRKIKCCQQIHPDETPCECNQITRQWYKKKVRNSIFIQDCVTIFCKL